MFRYLLLFGWLVLLTGCDSGHTKLSQKDVTFFGTGKVSRYQQHKDNSLEFLSPIFFAEIFITEGGNVKNASIKFPGSDGARKDLKYQYSESEEIGDVMYLSAMVEDYDELERRFPMGDYAFSFSTSEGEVKDSVVSYKDRTFPIHPIVIFKQENLRININDVDSTEELIITWPQFSEGRADMKNILDDPIFVAIDSCKIEDIVHSGRPFEKNGYLTFKASEYSVPAGKLEPGQTYNMYVEHAIFTDTQDEFGMPGFATLASSTYMTFTTTGDTDPNYCKD